MALARPTVAFETFWKRDSADCPRQLWTGDTCSRSQGHPLEIQSLASQARSPNPQARVRWLCRDAKHRSSSPHEETRLHARQCTLQYPTPLRRRIFGTIPARPFHCNDNERRIPRGRYSVRSRRGVPRLLRTSILDLHTAITLPSLHYSHNAAISLRVSQTQNGFQRYGRQERCAGLCRAVAAPDEPCRRPS